MSGDGEGSEQALAWANIDAKLDLYPDEEGALSNEEIVSLMIDRQIEAEDAIPAEPCKEAMELLERWSLDVEGVDWIGMWREDVDRRRFEAKWDLLERSDKLNDALILGESTPAFKKVMERQITFLTGYVWDEEENKKRKLEGKRPKRNTQDGDWLSVTRSGIDHILGYDATPTTPSYGLSRNPVGLQKDGFAFVCGSSLKGQRKRAKMDTMYAMGLDIDSGAKLEFVVDRAVELKVAVAIYPSWNHKKRGLTLKRDDVLKKLNIATDPTLEQVKDYLRNHGKNRFEEAFIDSVTLVEDHDDWTEIALDTPPIDKFRVIFFLDEPLSFEDLTKKVGTQQAALDLWEDKITGLAQKLLGVHFDTACTDASRLFYTARHAAKKASEHCQCYIIKGEPLKFDDIPTMRKSEYTRRRDGGDNNPFTQADDYRGDRPPEVTLPSGRSLNEWHSKKGKSRFMIADMLESESPDKIRPGGGKSGMVITECPFEHEHSKEGGTGTHATNALDSESDYWTWKCKHASCVGRHKLEFLGEAIKKRWFPEDVLDDETYLLPAEEEEEDDPDVVEDAAADALMEDLLTQASNFDETTRDRQIEALLAAAYEHREIIGDTGRRDLLAALKKSTKLGVPQLTGKWKSVGEAHTAKVLAEDARQRAERKTPDLVSREEATPESVAKAAAAAKWLPFGFIWKDGWFCQMISDKAHKVCREFEVLYCADGKKGSSRTNEVTIRYQHRSASLGIVESTFRLGDGYKDSGTILGRLRNEGLEFAPSAPTEAILMLLKAVDSDREAVYVERSGWLEGREVFVSPTGAVVKKDDDARVYVLDHTMKVANGRAGTLDDAVNAARAALKGRNAKRFLPGFLGGGVGCLVDFLDEELAVIVANEGEAKRGKTTALKAGIAWFAAPAADGLLMTGDVTPTAMEGKAVQASGAMFALDEQGTSKMEAQDEQAAVLQYGNRIGRGRGRTDGSVRDLATWHGCMGMSTERGLLDRLEAEQAKDSKVTIRSGAVSRVFTVSYDDAVKLDREQDKDELAAYDVLAHGGAYGWLGPEFAKALIGLGVDPVRARVSALEKEWGAGHSGAAERVVTTAALFGVAAGVAQEAGLLPSDVDLKTMLAELLDDTIAQRSRHLDTERQALDEVRRNILSMLNHQRIVVVGNTDCIRADIVGYYRPGRDSNGSSALKDREYIIPVDRRGQLSNTATDALVEKLRREDALVEPSERSKFAKSGLWVNTPGESESKKSLRIKGEWVHGDDEDEDEDEGRED